MGTLPSSKILREPQQKALPKGAIGRSCDGVARGTGGMFPISMAQSCKLVLRTQNALKQFFRIGELGDL